MTTLNLEFIIQENQRLARVINDLGELIIRENLQLYESIITAKFKEHSKENEKKFLIELYNYMIDKLKEIEF